MSFCNNFKIFLHFIAVLWIISTFLLSCGIIFFNISARNKDDDLWLYLVIQTVLFSRMFFFYLYLVKGQEKKYIIQEMAEKHFVWYVELNISNIIACCWGFIIYFNLDKDYYKENYNTLWLFINYYIVCMFIYIIFFSIHLYYLKTKFYITTATSTYIDYNLNYNSI